MVVTASGTLIKVSAEPQISYIFIRWISNQLECLVTVLPTFAFKV